MKVEVSSIGQVPVEERPGALLLELNQFWPKDPHTFDPVFSVDVRHWDQHQFSQLVKAIEGKPAPDFASLQAKIPERHILQFYVTLITLGKDAVKKLYSRQSVWFYAKRLMEAGFDISEYRLLREDRFWGRPVLGV